jgi:penicillin amidase
MGFFEPPDPRTILSADPTPIAAILGALKRHAVALALGCVALAGAYAANVEIGLHVRAVTRGVIVVRGLDDAVTIARDRRDIPHIFARNAHDLFFAEGYVQASDRLFQLDLTRRYAYGRLAEILGAKALPFDMAQRAVDIDGIARRQLRALSPSDRAAIVAFSDGINAAAATQPLPLEFRMLLYRPSRWTPKDSLAVSIVASLELADSWHNIFARDAVWRREGARCFGALFPLSDDRYDVTIEGARSKRTTRPPPSDCDDTDVAALLRRPAIGSNAWAAGAGRTVSGRALLANDPHLDLTIPGIWYVVEIQSPQVHAAGATIPGIPGVVLGHNERFAWASTNAEMTTTSLFAAGHLSRGSWVTQRFRVRFSRDVTAAYCRTARDFCVPDENDRSAVGLVRWPIFAESRSTIATALALERARGIPEAMRILASYRGSPQNFLLADRSGEVAYHVAGLVPNDPAWGRYVHPARDRALTFAPLSFAQLPGRAPSRATTLISANNKAYGASYPYRLSAQFEPPYRAFRIAELLRARPRYDAEYFATMQLDTLSPIDLEIARDFVRLARAHRAEQASPEIVSMLERWDGRFQPDSRAAALEHALRLALFEGTLPASIRLRLSRDLTGLSLPFGEEHAWADAGGTRIEHPLAPMNFAFLNGGWLPGAGDEYTIHLQEPGFAQGFRAIWDVGDWNRGGISIPSGESGEPGSQHYTDLTGSWVDGTLQPLPFGAAVARDARDVLVLAKPRPARGAWRSARRVTGRE